MGICCSFEDSGYSDPGPIFRPWWDLDPEEHRLHVEAGEYGYNNGGVMFELVASPNEKRAHYLQSKRHFNRWLWNWTLVYPVTLGVPTIGSRCFGGFWDHSYLILTDSWSPQLTGGSTPWPPLPSLQKILALTASIWNCRPWNELSLFYLSIVNKSLIKKQSYLIIGW